ncbi:hypothetical protein NCLIV_062680 [Neospora caninum Liverpool]|uniref:Uncharacterized protein n=1 Tax=Neospora caninum (strain Liverpool) TaxID=572307 RepID=F0VQ45_NEOCL|nr:hypothetical protein NCLIV_062680 [Neospora caninum Liverpool]CBZ55842.1 hypothetical protein NCLIV_062680 [Neospora caninum Liverpool]|eukprot:XP_003885868.1 hypothetical protein NCLIV_062680 [Neospora caninum Liverpool]
MSVSASNCEIRYGFLVESQTLVHPINAEDQFGREGWVNRGHDLTQRASGDWVSAGGHSMDTAPGVTVQAWHAPRPPQASISRRLSDTESEKGGGHDGVNRRGGGNPSTRQGDPVAQATGYSTVAQHSEGTVSTPRPSGTGEQHLRTQAPTGRLSSSLQTSPTTGGAPAMPALARFFGTRSGSPHRGASCASCDSIDTAMEALLATRRRRWTAESRSAAQIAELERQHATHARSAAQGNGRSGDEGPQVSIYQQLQDARRAGAAEQSDLRQQEATLSGFVDAQIRDRKRREERRAMQLQAQLRVLVAEAALARAQATLNRHQRMADLQEVLDNLAALRVREPSREQQQRMRDQEDEILEQLRQEGEEVMHPRRSRRKPA